MNRTLTMHLKYTEMERQKGECKFVKGKARSCKIVEAVAYVVEV
jgi:hypothetical protein